jgi:hypothetical protein
LRFGNRHAVHGGQLGLRCRLSGVDERHASLAASARCFNFANSQPTGLLLTAEKRAFRAAANAHHFRAIA